MRYSKYIISSALLLILIVQTAQSSTYIEDYGKSFFDEVNDIIKFHFPRKTKEQQECMLDVFKNEFRLENFYRAHQLINEDELEEQIIPHLPAIAKKCNSFLDGPHRSILWISVFITIILMVTLFAVIFRKKIIKKIRHAPSMNHIPEEEQSSPLESHRVITHI